MTATIVGFVLIAVLIILAADQTVKRLATTSRTVTPKQLTGEEWSLSGHVDSFSEDEFEIGFADYWTLGRPYRISLNKIESEGVADFEIENLELRVFPTGEGFDSEAFGRCSVLSENYRNAVIHIPYLVAWRLLDELRLRPNHLLHLRGRTAGGKTRLIGHFSLQSA